MKSWIKIVLLGFLGVLVVLMIIVGYFYYQFEGKYLVDKTRYEHYIGHLDNSDNYKRCSDKVNGWFASASLHTPIFKGSKSNFKKYITKQYIVSDTTANGFLNLRFMINCNGLVGDMEINEIDSNYIKTTFSKQLVDQLVHLSSRKENWAIPILDEPVDYYMYLIYKIEDGKIVEVLP